MKHISRYLIISVALILGLFTACTGGVVIESGPMSLSVDKEMCMTVGLEGSGAPLTEKSATEYIVLDEGCIKDFRLKKQDSRSAGDTTVYTMEGEASMPFGGVIKKIHGGRQDYETTAF